MKINSQGQDAFFVAHTRKNDFLVIIFSTRILEANELVDGQ